MKQDPDQVRRWVSQLANCRGRLRRLNRNPEMHAKEIQELRTESQKLLVKTDRGELSMEYEYYEGAGGYSVVDAGRKVN